MPGPLYLFPTIGPPPTLGAKWRLLITAGTAGLTINNILIAPRPPRANIGG